MTDKSFIFEQTILFKGLNPSIFKVGNLNANGSIFKIRTSKAVEVSIKEFLGNFVKNRELVRLIHSKNKASRFKI